MYLFNFQIQWSKLDQIKYKCAIKDEILDISQRKSFLRVLFKNEYIKFIQLCEIFIRLLPPKDIFFSEPDSS